MLSYSIRYICRISPVFQEKSIGLARKGLPGGSHFIFTVVGEGTMRRQDVFLAVIVPIIFGAGFVVAKQAINDVPPIMLVAFRFIVSGSILVWFFGIPRHHLKMLAWISVISVGVQYSMFYTGLRYMDVSLAIMIVQLEVPFLVLFAVLLLGERPSPLKYFGIAVAFAGAVVIVGSPQLEGAVIGVILIFGGVVTWAYGQILVSQIQDLNGAAVTAWISILAAPQLVFATLLFEDNHLEIIMNANWGFWAAVIYLGVAMNVIGSSTWYYLLSRYEVTSVGPYLLLVPITTVVGGVLFLGETLALRTIVGALIILIGLSLILFEHKVRGIVPAISR